MCSGVITVPLTLLCVADCAKRERGCTVLYTAFVKYNESASPCILQFSFPVKGGRKNNPSYTFVKETTSPRHVRCFSVLTAACLSISHRWPLLGRCGALLSRHSQTKRHRLPVIVNEVRVLPVVAQFLHMLAAPWPGLPGGRGIHTEVSCPVCAW